MDKVGWLVNDCLTCIPGTKTFWHNLLEWFPNLQDKTRGYTDYKILPAVIEKDLMLSYDSKEDKPYFIIRNGTYFRPIKTPWVKQISLIQDVQGGYLYDMQIETINNSDAVVFNSHYVYSKYKTNLINPLVNISIIPLGVDFDFFRPIPDRHPDVLPNSIIFIGSSTIYPKGFDTVSWLIANTNYNFCLVMKDNYELKNNDRVRVFNRVNMETVRLLINSSICGICTSKEETQHLSGLECGACNIPMISTQVGFYYDCKEDEDWGCVVNDVSEFPSKIEYVLNNKDKFTPRTYLQTKYSIEVCKQKWTTLINQI